MRYVKIPRERVAVLIGTDGSVKEQIEGHGVTLDIDSTTGDVVIQGKDSLAELDSERVIKSIGRGFTPPGRMR